MGIKTWNKIAVPQLVIISPVKYFIEK